MKVIFAITESSRALFAEFMDPNIRNGYFSGFSQGTEVRNLLVWSFKGEVIHARINYPGLSHDWKVTIFSKLYCTFINLNFYLYLPY